MATGTITIALSGLPQLILKPMRSSVRTAPIRIKPGAPTAYGFTTLAGIAARHRTFIWRLDLVLKGHESMLLERIISTSQERLAIRDNAAIINCSDETFETDAIAAFKPGRSIIPGSQATEGIENGYHCNFNTLIDDLGDGYDSYLRLDKDYRLLDSPRKVSIVLREI